MNSVIVAADGLLSSKKLKKLLEVILAFGNLMNSQRRGGVYGFKLGVVDKLLDTKSSDKRMNVMNYITKVISEKYPDASEFMADIRSIEKACQVSLQSVEQDVLALERTASLVNAELESDATNKTLLDFSRTIGPK